MFSVELHAGAFRHLLPLQARTPVQARDEARRVALDTLYVCREDGEPLAGGTLAWAVFGADGLEVARGAIPTEAV